MFQELPQLPQVLTMTIADVVHRDPGTGKFSILGTYNAIAAQDFPCIHPSLGVFLALTDGMGKTPLLLRLIDAEEERPPVFKIEATVSFVDPTQVAEMGFACQGVKFPEPGEYRLQLFAGGEPLLERRLFVHAVGLKGQRRFRDKSML